MIATKKSPAKKPLVIANWKAYLTRPEEVQRFALAYTRIAKKYSHVDLLIAPPFVLLPATIAAFRKAGVRIAAQSVSPFVDEKQTGEVEASMLKSLGVSQVIVGHSERRQYESNDVVRAQVAAAAKAGLSIILCVGEQERDAAGGHFSVIASQLTTALEKTTIPATKIIVAYEPVWAIGKSAKDAMQPDDAHETVIFIRKNLADILGRAAGVKVPILYGGSVEAENARDLLVSGGVSGFLVGHASTKVDLLTALLAAIQ